LMDIGMLLKEKILSYFQKKHIDITLKYIDPSYMIRSLPANANDSVFCGFLGRDAVTANGGKVVGAESYAKDETNFGDPIKKITGMYYKAPSDLRALYDSQRKKKKRKPKKKTLRKQREVYYEPIIDFDAVFIPDDPNRSAALVPQLAYYDVDNIQLLGTNFWHSDRFIRIARNYVQDAIMADVFFTDSTSPYVAEFVKEFKKIYGEKPGFIEAIAYDTTMILLELVSRQDITYKSTLRSELLKLQNYQGVTGLTSFKSDGNADKKLYILQIQDDKFVELESNNPVTVP